MTDQTASPLADLPPLIGLSGKARSGKDAVAGFLVAEHGYRRVAIADKIRDSALGLDPIIGTDPARRLSEVVDDLGWEQAKAVPEVRRTLQRLGTEAGWRIHGRNLWFAALEQTIDELGPGPIVVSDVRMPHDEQWLTDSGGVLWEVPRPDLGSLGLAGEAAAHASEAGGLTPSLLLVNDGTLEQLRTKAMSALSVTAASRGDRAPESPKTPTVLLQELSNGIAGQADIDVHAVVLDIMADVLDSALLAAGSAGLAATARKEVERTVLDYIGNHYAD